eukprot:379174-Pelagomonas_calceolata.AAC.5
MKRNVGKRWIEEEGPNNSHDTCLAVKLFKQQSSSVFGITADHHSKPVSMKKPVACKANAWTL